MRTLILYYSLTANTKFFAEKIASCIGADATLDEIAPFRDLARYGKLKYIVAGFQQLFKTRPALMPLEHDPADFDLIFIGTPVWMGRHAPAINSMLDTYDVTGKKVALFGSSGDPKPKDWLRSLRERLEKDNEITGTLLLGDPGKTTVASGEKIEAWVKTII